VTGTLPGAVSFTSGHSDAFTSDYTQAITFGNNFHFSLLLPDGTASNAEKQSLVMAVCKRRR